MTDPTTTCEKCGETYSWVNCRITKSDGRSWCLKCCVEEGNAKIKQ